MKDGEPDKPLTKNGIQVIARATSILRALRDEPRGLSLGQIADRVGLARSTVQRIVAALQDERLVINIGAGFKLGPEVTSLAQAATFNIVEVCRPKLAELVRATGETADLSVLRGGQMIFLDQAPGTHRLRTISAVGDVFPLTVTANGKAALALLARERAKTLAEAEWAREARAGDWKALEAELLRVREDGLAFDLEEHAPGISAIGIAFHDPGGAICSISVPIPTSRFTTARPLVEAELRDAAVWARALFDVSRA